MIHTSLKVYINKRCSPRQDPDVLSLTIRLKQQSSSIGSLITAEVNTGKSAQVLKRNGIEKSSKQNLSNRREFLLF